MVKVFFAFWFVFGLLVFGHRYWQSWVIERVADMPQQTDLLPQPTMVIPTIDPGQLQRAINPPIGPMPGAWRR
jgi:hypothetical protein